MFFKQLRISFIVLALFTIITGLVYPLAVTGIAQLVFPGKANGSLIYNNGKAVGSELIGQPFSNPRYFWGRPSATTPYAYNAASSYASNYGPLSQGLHDEVSKRIHDLKAADPSNTQPIPADLATSSGSGLDPHISIAAALYQVPRVARSRNLSQGYVRRLVDASIQERQLGFLGEPRIDVLQLNLALDEETLSKGE